MGPPVCWTSGLLLSHTPIGHSPVPSPAAQTLSTPPLAAKPCKSLLLYLHPRASFSYKHTSQELTSLFPSHSRCVGVFTAAGGKLVNY